MLHKKLALIALIMLTVLVLPLKTSAKEPEPNQPLALTLEDSLKLAYENSLTLKAAGQKVTITQADVRQAKAGFWPTVEYSLGAQKYSEDQLSAGGSDETSGGDITASVPLYSGSKLNLNLDIAQAQLNLALENQRQTKQQLTYDVKQAYYQVWMAEEVLKVAQASYDNLGQHVAKVRRQYQVGAASKYNLLQAEVQHEGLKPQVIQAENGVALARLNLATRIGLDKNRAFTVVHDAQIVNPEYVEPTEDLVSVAFINRPELKQIAVQKEIAAHQVKLAKSQYKPNVSLSGSYQFQGPEWTPDSWEKQWVLSLGVTGNFYKPDAKPVTDAAEGQIELLIIQTNELKDQVHLEVEQGLQTIRESVETTKANQANIELARESLRMTQARYDAGMSTTMEIMDAQLALDQALNGYYQGLSAYLTALAKLDLVTGQPMDTHLR